MLLSCDSVVELKHGNYRAQVAPSAGGRVIALEYISGGVARQLLVPWNASPFDEHKWPKAGAFPMAPFANRLPARGFMFLGRHIRPLMAPGGVPIHGFTHRRPWNVIEVSPGRVSLEFVHDATDASWPWAWQAEQEVTLDSRGLTMRLTISNRGKESMPLALGWHPYHPISPELTAADWVFEAASRHALCADGSAGAPLTKPSLPLSRGETAAFSGWDGKFLMKGPDAWIAVTCESVSHLVLHRPSHGNYLCVEPVTCLPGRLGDERSVLESGASRSLTWTCTWQAEMAVDEASLA